MFVLVCTKAQSPRVFQIDNSVGSLRWSFVDYVGLLLL